MNSDVVKDGEGFMKRICFSKKVYVTPKVVATQVEGGASLMSGSDDGNSIGINPSTGDGNNQFEAE